MAAVSLMPSVVLGSSMEEGLRSGYMGLLICLLFATTFYSLCDGRVTSKNTMLKTVNHMEDTFSSSYPYIDSPFTMPPYDDVMGSPPPSSPLREPIYCVYPPPQPPLTTIPPPPSTATFSSPPPPPPPIIYYSPFLSPSPTHRSPPPKFSLSPPKPISNPPIIILPSPPKSNIPSPPTHGYFPSPQQFVPGPPIFQPPVVYPPPSGFPPPSSGSGYALWCVAKPSVPDPIILEAMNYACGSGADCDSIKPNGSCYEPNTLLAHASFAFNSYWQRTRVAGATCDFGGTAMLVTKDPSFDGCKFLRT